MSIAIADDHVNLAEVAADFLSKRDVKAAAKALLDGAEETAPAYWGELAGLGWLGLHIAEADGGSGFGLLELLVIVEAHGRALAPGPFIPTVAASAVINAAGSAELRSLLLPGLASGETVGAVGLGGNITVRDGKAYGAPDPVIGGALADLLVLQSGEDAIVVDTASAGVSRETPANLDPTRRTAKVSLDGVAAQVITGGGRLLVDLTRLVYAAEALGIARSCTNEAAEYAKIRTQFGRPIAMFQAVKHHCANMLVATELSTAAVWDAAGTDIGHSEAFTYAAAVAATLALPAADLTAQLNIQVHGGIGFTWEHDAHLYLRRATVLESVIDVEAAAVEIATMTAGGTKLARGLDLGPEAEPFRAEVQAFVAGLADRSRDEQRAALVDSGFAMPHWPKPWGLEASAVQQLVIEEEFAAAGVKTPSYGITGWVILTLVQHATEEQVARWVRPALDQELIWCQLFSEPDAGSDAAGVKTRATKVEGGWRVSGQKVWTSGAHLAAFGLATVRTDPDVPKHDGITTMVIDMKADGVDIRPLKMPSGQSEFNEVFFDDVFVPDTDVVGPVNGGWTVARATLGNESVSLGGSGGGMAVPLSLIAGPLTAHPERLLGGLNRFGHLAARTMATEAMNLRRAHRALAGAAPGPEGAVGKLVLTESMTEAAAIMVAVTGPDGAFLDGPGQISGQIALSHRAMSIAGGTSEIKRNQIGERLLGLPRDPLIK